jgi:hypothetical protein
MGALKAIFTGMGITLRKPRLLAILYAVNLACAGLVALPFLILVQQELGHSLLGLRIQPADLNWLGEAVLEHGASLPAMAAGVLGAIVDRLLDKEGRAGLAEFAADGGRYFWRYVRLFLISLVFLVLTLGVFMSLVSALFEPLSKAALTEWPALILSNLHFLIALLLLSVVHMVVDYARIAVAAEGERRVLRALRHVFTFLRKRFFRAWAIYLLLVVLTLLGSVVFYFVFNRLGDPSVIQVVAGLAVMQLYMVFRIWVRTLFVAAQAEFYKAHPY